MNDHIPNKKIILFINEFEQKFGSLLMLESEHKTIEQSGAEHQIFYQTDYFDILQTIKGKDSGNTEYSDWDLHCKVYNEKINLEVVNQMKSCTMTFKHFYNQGIILSKKIEHKNKDIHVAIIQKLQCMGFMKEEIESPFVDITIHGIPNFYMRQLSKDISDEEFISWMMITSRRKKLKQTSKDDIAAKEYLRLILQTFPNNNQRDENDAYNFFENYLIENGYNIVVNYLKQEKNI